MLYIIENKPISTMAMAPLFLAPAEGLGGPSMHKNSFSVCIQAQIMLSLFYEI